MSEKLLLSAKAEISKTASSYNDTDINRQTFLTFYVQQHEKTLSQVQKCISLEIISPEE